MAERVFGMSTRVCHPGPLTRQHLLDIAARGFRTIELYAHRAHLDYHADASVADLQAWLADAGLTLDAVHAPVAEPLGGGRRDAPLSIASADAAAREHALDEAARALHVARRLPTRVFVVHLGLPRALAPPGGDTRDAARRSVEALRDLAAPLGVRVALEVLGNELSRPGSLVHFLERTVGPAGLGLCLDTGHAHLEGGVVDAIETMAEHLMAVDLHDNRGRVDDHALPFEGTIDWPAALTTLQKVGYDGPLMFDPAPRAPLADLLARAERARRTVERHLTP